MGLNCQSRQATVNPLSHAGTDKHKQAGVHEAHNGSEIALQILQSYQEVPNNSSSHFEMDIYPAATMDP